AKKDGKKAIFDIDGKMITKEWFDDIELGGLVKGECDLYIAKKNDREAVFDVNGNRIIGWYEWIDREGLFGKGRYIKVMYGDEWAIFDKDGNQISPDWFDKVWEDGLLREESNYYLATKYGKDAIFDKDGKQITDWFDYVFEDGLIKGQSSYYIVIKEDKQAIFNKNGQQISYWFDWIDKNGFVDGHSGYYEVRKNGKYAIFYKDGQRVTE
ncbi:MAG: hypothetical protein ACP5QM_08170, partial [Caldisericum sp.]